MPEKLNFKIEIPKSRELTEREEALRRTTVLRPQTVRGIMNLINSMNLDEEIAAELKRMAAKYPNDALPHFRKNIQTHISKIRARLRPRNKEYDTAHEKGYVPSESVVGKDGESVIKPSRKYHGSKEDRKKQAGTEEVKQEVETLDHSEFAFFRDEGF